MRLEAEGALDSGAKQETRRERQRNGDPCGHAPTEHAGNQPPWQSMRQGRARIANGVNPPDGTGPPQLVLPQLSPGALGADMAYNEGRNCNLSPTRSKGHPKKII